LNPLHLGPTPPRPGSGSPKTIDDACLDVYRREFDYITRTLRRLGVAPGDEQDLAHEVFLVLWRTWSQYDPTRPLRPYLFGIAFRVAATYRRRTWREVSFAVVDGPDLAPVPDQAIEANQARTLVLAALEKIALPKRAVLLMHDVDDVPMREVAATLAIPLFTAYSRLRKARREFEASLAQMQKRTGVR
jgi:RNA polymerase sigma-70 factor (ECF subfamily)